VFYHFRTSLGNAMDEARPNPSQDIAPPPPDAGANAPTPALLSAQPPAHNLFLGPAGLRPGWRIFLYLGMGVILFLILSSFRHLIPSRDAGYLWQELYMEMVLVVSSLVPAFLMARVEKRQFCSYGLPLRQARGKWFCIGLVWGIVALSGLILLIHLAGDFSYGHLVLHKVRILKFAAFWALYFSLVGIFEEFTFRGYTQFTLTQAIGFWPAAFILSFVFGALHLIGNVGETWIGSLCAALIGLFFCFTLYRTGSLWFAVGMHASWDWAESYLYSVPDSGEIIPGHLINSSFHGSRWLTGGSVGPEGSVLVFVVIAVVWMVFALSYPAKRAPESRVS